MAQSSLVNVSEIIDQRPLGRPQITIIVLCGLVALLDGFDAPRRLWATLVAILWARFGSFVGPLVVAALLARQLPVGSICVTIGLPGIVAAITAAFVGIRYARDDRRDMAPQPAFAAPATRGDGALRRGCSAPARGARRERKQAWVPA